MKTPREWLDEQVGDRPEDFSDEDNAQALAWIGRIQRDAARPCPMRPLVIAIVILAIAVALRLLARP